jgi:hypothetical protein
MLNVYNSKDSGTKAARMTDAEYEQWERGDTTEYAGFTIKPKRDFGERGFYDADTRRNVKEGWVIVKDGCNAMPGATWAHTQARATQMIDVFMAVDQDSQKFWHLLRAINAGEAEPVVKKKGEVSFILGYPQVDDAALAKFLEGVVGIIEDTVVACDELHLREGHRERWPGRLPAGRLRLHAHGRRGRRHAGLRQPDLATTFGATRFCSWRQPAAWSITDGPRVDRTGSCPTRLSRTATVASA